MIPLILAAAASVLPVIPLPRSAVRHDGSYALKQSVTIEASTADERNVAEFTRAFLQMRGLQVTIVSHGAADIAFQGDAHDATLGTEGYRLRSAAEGVRITANGGPGLFYGLQTLEQLLPPGATNEIARVDITDSPSYAYRGIHLDVARHFFPISFVEKYIDIAARYKLNSFHWHLTDDQGWRIEIRKYPRLTSVASCRSGTMLGHDFSSDDKQRYCGYYTQDEIRQVVAYAKKRYVTIVPEIEMPGHSVEVLAAYPQLACAPGHYEVRRTWGVSDQIVCPSEQTIAFYEDVLREVIALFPGPYIHTGGDEAPKAAWKNSALVQSLKRKYHLQNDDAVQGWFDTRIEAFLRAHGRRMIGWDEILGGNVSRSAIVMSWRGVAGGVIAAMRGNDVIMSPDGPLYFDASAGDGAFEPLNIGGKTTLRDVYDFDPGIDALPPEQAKHVLGAQANLWTEYIPTQAQAEYMLMPRLLALAELTWTPVEEKDWDSFVARTPNQYARLEQEQFQFRIPEPVGLADTNTDKPSIAVSLSSPVPGARLFYTTDGTMPTASSTAYTQPITLNLQPGETKIVRVITILASGRMSAPAQALYERTLLTPAVP